jgi:membrane protein YdbS with pleckstrin-like domain
MRFIQKKNFLKTEGLIYRPLLHWMFPIRHMVLSVPFFLLLLVFWEILRKQTGFFGWPEQFAIAVSIQIILSAVKYVFLAGAALVLLIFICRVFLYLSTEFGVTNRRLIMKKGIIRVVINEIPLDRIESISCLRGIMGRIFNYGTVCVSGIGGMKLVFYMVNRPLAFRRKIIDIIEKNKMVTVIPGVLPKLNRVPKEESVQQEESVYRYGTSVRVLS